MTTPMANELLNVSIGSVSRSKVVAVSPLSSLPQVLYPMAISPESFMSSVNAFLGALARVSDRNCVSGSATPPSWLAVHQRPTAAMVARSAISRIQVHLVNGRFCVWSGRLSGLAAQSASSRSSRRSRRSSPVSVRSSCWWSGAGSIRRPLVFQTSTRCSTTSQWVSVRRRTKGL